MRRKCVLILDKTKMAICVKFYWSKIKSSIRRRNVHIGIECDISCKVSEHQPHALSNFAFDVCLRQVQGHGIFRYEFIPNNRKLYIIS